MKLSPIDLLFVRMESVENPAHVASMAIFDIPDDYPGNFVRDLHDRLLTDTDISKPFNLRLKPQGILPGWNEWEEDVNLDLGFHVRHSALPQPGSMDDLMHLVSRLHARMLDRSRPLWECYLIEGLEGNRFATYLKTHHSIIDGAGGMAIIENGLSREPDTGQVLTLWGAAQREKSKATWPGLQKMLMSASGTVLKQALAVPQAAFAIFAPSLGLKKTAAGKAFRGGKTMFNKQVNASRNFGIGTLSFQEVKDVGKSLGATVNDIFLASCAGAMCDYMEKKGEPPEPGFSAGVPVALSREGGNNALAYIVVALHPEITDPLERVAAIHESARDAKHDHADLSRTVINTMTLMAQGTQAALGQLGLAEIVPPATGLIISNVPGFREHRYLMGARLSALYPMSVLVHAQGLNITVLSYAGELQYGLLSTPEITPNIQELADGVEREFKKIKAAASKRRGKKPRVRKSKIHK